jgi:hypothetical protein
MRFFWFVCVTVVLTLSLSACGGKSVHTPDDADLREMVMITSEGLPWPVTLLGDQAKSNEAAASEYSDKEQWLRNYDEWGRTGGHAASLRSEGAGPSTIQTEVEYYTSTESAGSAWSAVRDFVVSDEALQSLRAGGFAGAQIAEVDAEKVGDESTAFGFWFQGEGGTAVTFAVLFRREGVLAMASVEGAEGVATVEDAVAVARQLDARIQDILQR